MLANGLASDGHIVIHPDGSLSLTATGYELCETLANVEPHELDLVKRLVESSGSTVVIADARQSSRETLEALAEMGALDEAASGQYRRRRATPVFATIIPIAQAALRGIQNFPRTQDAE